MSLPWSERWLYSARRTLGRRAVGRTLSAVWRGGAKLHRAAFRYGLRSSARLPVPLVAVGSPLVGGAGRTAVAWWIAEQLERGGAKVAIGVTRGARDEAQMLSWRCENRPHIKVAQREELRALRANWSYDVAVLDGGLYHHTLEPDLRIALVSPDFDALGPMPDGPLRSPLGDTLPDLVWLHDGSGVAELPSQVSGREPDVVSRYVLDGVERIAGTEPDPSTLPVLVSAIGRNGNVSQLLQHNRLAIRSHLSFRDHHTFTAANLAPCAGRHVLTTEKDWPRLQPFAHLMSSVSMLRLRLEIVAGAPGVRARLLELAT